MRPSGSRVRSTSRRRWRKFFASCVVVLALCAAGLALWLRNHQPPAVPAPPLADPTGTVLPDTQQASAELDGLTVAWNRNWESYERNAFGPGWSGRGGEPTLANGCTAREEVMRRDLRDVRTADSKPCLVLSGVLPDPYTGEQLPYDRFKASGIEIDHVVALGDAWRSGASEWTAEQRERFANDPTNLLAVQKQANQDKGSKTPDQWKPRQEYWCDYARRWVAVKSRYALTVQPTEKSALADMLRTCLPTPGR